ncbi:hypothetical protein KEM52_004667 [Ascosphaera acerosa]|nr:hypothetical protein KEM52_004667 [Ascosphaera acerosa]
MWILSSNGDTFKGKRLWLRPGKKYLFGRVRRENSIAVVDSVTVSRKHLTIEVLPAEDGSHSNAGKRTRVLITDLNTKCGSRFDGRFIRNETVELDGEGPFALQVGRSDETYTVHWVNVVISVDTPSVAAKSPRPELDQTTEGQKSHQAPRPDQQQYDRLWRRLAPADVTVVAEYLPGVTTHVLQDRRMSPWTMQALIEGARIISPAFVDAIEYAAAPANVGDPYSHCPLEDDFDGSFPAAEMYMPGRQAGERPAISDRALLVNLRRHVVFEGYTFVFTNEGQFTTMLPAITSGHGKAALHEVQEGPNAAEQLVNFVRSIAQKKGAHLDQNASVALLELAKSSEQLTAWAKTVERDFTRLAGLKPVTLEALAEAVVHCDATRLIEPVETERVQETPEPEVTELPSSPVLAAVNAKEGADTTHAVRSKRARDDVTTPAADTPVKSAGAVTLENQPPSDTDLAAGRPNKRLRVRQFRSRVDTFAVISDDELAPPPPLDVDQSVSVLAPLGTGRAVAQQSQSDADDRAAPQRSPGVDETHLGEEGITALLPGAESLKTHAFLEAAAQRRAHSPVAEVDEDPDDPGTGPTSRSKRRKLTVATGGNPTHGRTRLQAKQSAAEPAATGTCAEATSRRARRGRTTTSHGDEDAIVRAAVRLREEQERQSEARRRAEESPFHHGGNGHLLGPDHRLVQQSVQPATSEGGVADSAVVATVGSHVPPLQPTLEDLGLAPEEIDRLVIVEEMKMTRPTREKRNDAPEDVAQARWDPRWSGRRNFKNFRKQHRPDVDRQSGTSGTEPGSPEEHSPYRGMQTTQVPLVEVVVDPSAVGELRWEDERPDQPRLGEDANTRNVAPGESASGGDASARSHAVDEASGMASWRRRPPSTSSRGTRAAASRTASYQTDGDFEGVAPPSRQQHGTAGGDGGDDTEDDGTSFRWRRRRRQQPRVDS